MISQPKWQNRPECNFLKEKVLEALENPVKRAFSRAFLRSVNIWLLPDLKKMSMKNDDNKIKDVKSTVNLISGAYTLPLLNKLFSNSQRIEDRRLETEEEKIPV